MFGSVSPCLFLDTSKFLWCSRMVTSVSRGLDVKIAVLMLLLLLKSANSARAPVGVPSSLRTTQQDVHRQHTTQLISQMRIHGFLLWASMGFLMPVGVLVIRMSIKVRCGKSLKMLFYSHVILQIASVLLATAGAVLAVMNFENAFNNSHQRMGLAVYALMWLQPLIGFLRPHRGTKGRTIWYFVHWFLGTGLSILAIINIYFGLHAYHVKTLRSTGIWTVLFTAEVSIIAFIYLLQDRWDYMQKQGVTLDHEQVTPADQMSTPLRNFLMWKV
uniref:Putative ferric-chelate reductase 1 n=1 Tax=Anthurium amnicola TaxID=1678845 RepID=A0A1D1YNZ2_9ARAE